MRVTTLVTFQCPKCQTRVQLVSDKCAASHKCPNFKNKVVEFEVTK
jgi:hypothetical protein